jgi:hypothetical protein
MSKVLEKERNGTAVSWKPQPGDRYDVTGVDRYGRRFSMRFQSWFHAKCINLWRGNKWLVRNGKRYRIQSISN